MDLRSLLKEKMEKQISSWNAEIESAEAQAKARQAEAESEAADAELEKELWSRVKDLRDKVEEGRRYLGDLAEAGEDQLEKIKGRIAGLFD